MIPSELTPVLEKIRKGTTSNLNLKQIQSVLPYLDIDIKRKPIAILLSDKDLEPRLDREILKEKGSYPKSIKFYVMVFKQDPNTPKIIQKLYNEYKKLDRPNQPKNKVYYKTYISDISQIQHDQYHEVQKMGFEILLYRGAIGYEVDTGKETYTQDDFTKILHWLYNHTEIKSHAASLLGKQEHIPGGSSVRDLTNTGICAVCFKNVKLRHGYIVDHGYKRPGIGYHVGLCPGVRWPPYEISFEGTQNYIDKYLLPNLKNQQKILDDILNDNVETITTQRGSKKIEITSNDPSWDRALKYYKIQTENNIRYLKKDIAEMKQKVHEWKFTELP